MIIRRLYSCLFFSLVCVCVLNACGGGSSKGNSDSRAAVLNCDGACPNTSLSPSDVQQILSQASAASAALGVNATFAVTDRVGNVLAVYVMPGASSTTTIRGPIGATGGLEGTTVPATLAAISKAGTGAYLSSQGNAFSTRTASFIVQEHFAPGQRNAPGGPLFGVQFSQLPCSDVKHPSLGPRPLPLGLSADPGGIPLYKGGDNVGGLGVELDGLYSFDANIQDTEENSEEQIAMAAAHGFESPPEILAERITVGGQALRFSDTSYEEASQLSGVTTKTEQATGSTGEETDVSEESSEISEEGEIAVPISLPFDTRNLVAVPPFAAAAIRGGAQFGTASSGIALTTRAGVPAAFLVGGAGVRFPTQAGASAGATAGLSGAEVDALLDSALLTANRMRAAIRQPLNSSVRVSIFVVDSTGTPLGFIRSNDAPVFGIDVALQKARTAAFFSSPDANDALSGAGFGGYVAKAKALFPSGFDGTYAFSDRAIGNLSRPFFPDGIDGNGEGPLSLPFPGSGVPSWSPFNTGLQLDMAIGAIAAPLSGSIPSSCTPFGRRLGNGIQIFSGSVPLYRGGSLVGALGISGDGIFQDDMVAFVGASRQGLDFAGHSGVGDATLGFNAPPDRRSDVIPLNVGDSRLRYVNCPESAFIDGTDQNICAGL